MTQVESPSKNLLVCRRGFANHLIHEIQSSNKVKAEAHSDFAVLVDGFPHMFAPDQFIFARQILPRVMILGVTQMESVLQQIEHIILAQVFPVLKSKESQWTIHSFSMDDDDALKTVKKLQGVIKSRFQQHGGRKDFQALHQKFIDSEQDSEKLGSQIAERRVVQIFGLSKDSVAISIGSQADGVMPNSGGVLRMKTLHGAPSRSARKLSEALMVAGFSPKRGETAVDLGAAPGGWSFVLASKGVSVTAVDHASLTMNSKVMKSQVIHVKDDGKTYEPYEAVDWLVCDMVMGFSETLKVLQRWTNKRLARHFVVNLKLPRETSKSISVFSSLADVQLTLKVNGYSFFKVKQLYHDRHEVTLMGSINGGIHV